MSAGPLPPPGWYADPWGQPAWRWWDGDRWTATVSAQGSGAAAAPASVVGSEAGYGYVPERAGPSTPDPSVAVSPAPAPAGAPWPTLPLRALWYAAGGIFGGFVLASTVAIVCVGLGLSLYSPVTVVLDLCALWLILGWAAIRASRRFGTGSVSEDYHFGFQPFDAARGVWASLVGRLAVTVVTGLVLAAAGHSVSGNTEVLKQQQGHPWHVLFVGAGAVVGAPIFEELFFRGLVLRSLASRLPYARAVLIQGVLFGLAHAQGGQDAWSTFAIVAGTATFGVVQGIFAARWRLGALMVSHGLYNLLPVLIVAFS